jgi:hypothetical protein
MVPVAGLEPARLTAKDFESSKSTIPSYWPLNKDRNYSLICLK